MQNTTNKQFTDAFAIRLGASAEGADQTTLALAELPLAEQARIFGQQHDIPSADRDPVDVWQSRAAGSTGGYAGILSDGFSQTAHDAYEEMPASWGLWANEAETENLSPTHISFEDTAEPKQVRNDGEYPMTAITTSERDYTLGRHGERFGFTYEMLKNDETGIAANMIQNAANKAVRCEERAVYTALLANGNLGDGAIMFSAARGTLVQSNALGESGLQAAITALMNLKANPDEGSRYLHAWQPAAIVVPPDLYLLAYELAQGDGRPGFAVASSPFLSADDLTGYSTTTWYLTADKRQADSIVLTFLKGQRKPDVQRIETLDFDGVVFRIRHICGAVAGGSGAIKNTA